MTSITPTYADKAPAAPTAAGKTGQRDWSNVVVGRPHVYCPHGCPGPLTWQTDDNREYAACRSCKREYPFESNVLVLDNTATEADFPAATAAEFTRIEKRHFWLRGRNQIVRSIIGRAPDKGRPLSVLDVGCGTGTMSAWLQHLGYNPVGLDMHEAGLRIAAQRLGTLQVCCDARKMPFRNTFDYVSLFDVIEHTDDDVGLLRLCRGALRDDGRVILTVPADMRLWSPYDVLFGHKRRYTKSQLIESCRAAGLHIERIRYYNALLWPVQYLVRRWQSARTTEVVPNPETIRQFLAPPPAPLNTLLSATMRLEAALLPYVSPPFGAALIALARKTAE